MSTTTASDEGFQPWEVPVPSNHPNVAALAAQSSCFIFESDHHWIKNHNKKGHSCSNDNSSRRNAKNAAVRTQEFENAAAVATASASAARSDEVVAGEGFSSISLSAKQENFFIHEARRRNRTGSHKGTKRTDRSDRVPHEIFVLLRPKADTVLSMTEEQQPPSRARGSFVGLSASTVAPLDRQKKKKQNRQRQRQCQSGSPYQGPSPSKRTRSKSPLSTRRRGKANTTASAKTKKKTDDASLVERGAEPSKSPNQSEDADADATSILRGIICGRAQHENETKPNVSEWSSHHCKSGLGGGDNDDVDDAAAAAAAATAFVHNDSPLPSPFCQIYKNCYCDYCFEVGSQWKTKECTPNNPRKLDCRTRQLEETSSSPPPRVALFNQSMLHPTPTIRDVGDTESSPEPEQQQRRFDFDPTTYTTPTLESREERELDWIEIDGMAFPSAIPSTSTF